MRAEGNERRREKKGGGKVVAWTGRLGRHVRGKWGR